MNIKASIATLSLKAPPPLPQLWPTFLRSLQPLSFRWPGPWGPTWRWGYSMAISCYICYINIVILLISPNIPKYLLISPNQVNELTKQITMFHIIHPASRGVAAHTAGLFRSVRGAKGGVESPPLGNFCFSPLWGLPKLGNFHFSPPWGLPKLGNFHFSPPWGLPKLWNFHFPPLEALQAAEFQIARQRRLDSPPNPVFFECVSMFLQWFPSKHGTFTLLSP